MGEIVKRICAELELDPPAAERLVRTFLRATAEDLRLIEESVALGRAAGIAEPAHSIKGAAANLDFQVARRAAVELEALGKSGQIGQARAHLDALRREMERIRSDIEAG